MAFSTTAPNSCSLHKCSTLIGDSRLMAAEERYRRSRRTREPFGSSDGMLREFSFKDSNRNDACSEDLAR
jgi:hypothetical protein